MTAGTIKQKITSLVSSSSSLAWLFKKKVLMYNLHESVYYYTLRGHLNPFPSFDQKNRDSKEIKSLLISWKIDSWRGRLCQPFEDIFENSLLNNRKYNWRKNSPEFPNHTKIPKATTQTHKTSRNAFTGKIVAVSCNVPIIIYECVHSFLVLFFYRSVSWKTTTIVKSRCVAESSGVPECKTFLYSWT